MTEPTWMRTARRLIGTREIVGKRHSPTILGWARELAGEFGAWVKSAPFWSNDETPWCGLFVAKVFFAHGLKVNANFPSARAWANWGRACNPCPGAVLVFGRKGGGHVGFYVSETATHFNVLGGNQGNAVNIMAIAKSRLLATRWPAESKQIPGAPVAGAAAARSNGNEA
jgi:uncharacterized protein (TIGR02594 family)